ncbi:MAG: hypothetical protein KDK33_14005, partial [Leptospiraceae bacterium]|nr:hypothetical protein [Leptospiraceae bacterium]
SLGGNRSLVLRNLFVTMFLAGLWHGAGLMFIGWGIYHGFFLILERYLGQGKADGNAPGLGLGSTEGFSWTRIPRQILTLHLVLLGWVLFRSHNLDQFMEFFSTIGNMKWAIPNAKPMYIAVVVLAYMYHLSPVAWREKAADLWNRQKLAVQIALTFVLLTGLYQISVQDVQPFIYFQF